MEHESITITAKTEAIEDLKDDKIIEANDQIEEVNNSKIGDDFEELEKVKIKEIKNDKIEESNDDILEECKNEETILNFEKPVIDQKFAKKCR